MTPDPLTPSPDSPTPRCDSLGIDEWAIGNLLVVSIKWKDLARQLERENAALVKEREELRNELAYAKDLINTQSDGVHNSYKTISELQNTLAERDREIGELRKRLASRLTENEPALLGDLERVANEYIEENHSLRAQLAETQLKLKEAEALRDKWAHEANARFVSWEKAELDLQVAQKHNNEQAAQLIALQAHVEELKAFAKEVGEFIANTYDNADWFNKAKKLLSAQPDLTLIEEVREALAMVEQDHLFPFTVDHDVLLPKVQQLLTRLNPRKD